jgi:hypothetical protein
MEILRRQLPKLMVKGTPRRPALKATDGPEDGYELDWTDDDWSRPLEQPYAHGYDATRMYLAAAQACEVLAPWKLVHTGKRVFDPKRAGWWKVELGPWNDDRIPAPAGPGESVRWVTTPTLVLLQELQEAGGAFQSFEVIDSWTQVGKRLLRSWAETIESAYHAGKDLRIPHVSTADDWTDGLLISSAAKAAYRETIGLLKPNAGPDSSPTYRPDWHYSLIAQSRSTLWRKVWAIGLAEDRWPLTIHVDHVWYGSDDADPEDSKPAGIALVNAKGHPDTLGTFKMKGYRERKTA